MERSKGSFNKPEKGKMNTNSSMTADALSGQVAVVTGGSRGIGAAI